MVCPRVDVTTPDNQEAFNESTFLRRFDDHQVRVIGAREVNTQKNKTIAIRTAIATAIVAAAIFLIAIEPGAILLALLMGASCGVFAGGITFAVEEAITSFWDCWQLHPNQNEHLSQNLYRYYNDFLKKAKKQIECLSVRHGISRGINPQNPGLRLIKNQIRLISNTALQVMSISLYPGQSFSRSVKNLRDDFDADKILKELNE